MFHKNYFLLLYCPIVRFSAKNNSQAAPAFHSTALKSKWSKQKRTSSINRTYAVTLLVLLCFLLYSFLHEISKALLHKNTEVFPGYSVRFRRIRFSKEAVTLLHAAYPCDRMLGGIVRVRSTKQSAGIIVVVF